MREKHWAFRFMILNVVSIIVISSVLTTLLYWLYSVLFHTTGQESSGILRLFIMAAVVLLDSLILSFFTMRKARKSWLNPLSSLLEATKLVANGDFSVRVKSERLPVRLKEYVDSFNQMTEALGHEETERNDFMNTFSHEFKTPMVSIRGFAKLMKSPDLSEEKRNEYADIIIRESQRLGSMAADILLLSRVNDTRIIPSKERYRLDEQIRECISLQEREWLKKDIVLNGELSEESYNGNPEMVSHIWSNLLSNAIKFTPPHGTITVRLFRREGCLYIVFSDTGIGMSPEAIRHMYDRFYQADTSRTGAGSGLGLSIVQRIVTLCGGTVSACSTPGKGTTFTVTLPDE